MVLLFYIFVIIFTMTILGKYIFPLFKKSQPLDISNFLQDSWCFLDVQGNITQRSPNFLSFLELKNSVLPSPFVWNLITNILKTEQSLSLKEKFEKFTQQSVQKIISETLQTKKGKHYLFRLWKVSENRYLMWTQEMELPTLPSPSLIPAYPATITSERYKLGEILSELPILLWHHTEKQQMDYCNTNYAEMLGQNIETVLQKKESLFPSSQVASLFQKVKKSGKLQKARLSKFIAGERHFFDLWEKVDPEGGSWGLGIDISEYEKTRETSKQELKALEKIFDYFSIAVAIFTKNQKLMYFNKAYLKLFKLDEKWLSKHPTFEEIFDELRNQRLLPEVTNFSSYKKKFLSFFEENVHLKEDILHLPDERSLHLTVASYPLGGLIVLYEDITERLILERKNNTMVVVQNALANHLQEGVLIFGVDHRLKLMNAFCAKLWSIDDVVSIEGEYLNQLLNKTKDLFDYGKNWSLFKANILAGVAHRSPKKGVIHRKDGLSLKFHYVPLPNGDHLITYQDISDSLKFQELLEESTRLLDATHFIKNAFLESTATDLNQWGSTFSKFSLALGKKVTTFNKKQKESVFELVKISENLKKNVSNVISLTESSAQDQPFSINLILDPIFQLFHKLIQQKNIHIVKNIDETVPILLNKSALSRLFYSLLGYAFHGCPEEDRFHISLEIIKNKMRFSLSCRLNVIAKMQDPIASNLEQAFHRNTDFSLTLIKQLSVLCGGDLKVGSRNQKRLRITCDFPLAENTVAPIDQAPPKTLFSEESLTQDGKAACG